MSAFGRARPSLVASSLASLMLSATGLHAQDMRGLRVRPYTGAAARPAAARRLLLSLAAAHRRGHAVVFAIIGAATALPAASQEADGARGRPRLVAQLGAGALVLGGALSPDGDVLATSTLGNRVIVWDSAGFLLRRFDIDSWPGSSPTFTADGSALIAAGPGGIRRVDVRTGETVFTSASQVGEVVLDIAVSPDGRLIIPLGLPELRWLDAMTGVERLRLLVPVPVDRAAFSPDGQLLVTTSGRGGQIRDAATGAVLHEIADLVNQAPDFVTAVAFSPDGVHVATAAADGTTRLWEARSGQLVRSFEDSASRAGGHAPISEVAVSPDGRYLAVTTGSETVLRDISSGVELRTLPGKLIGFSPNGILWLTGSAPPTSRFGDWANAIAWDPESGVERRRVAGKAVGVHAVEFLQNGRGVLAHNEDRVATLWDVPRATELYRADAVSSTTISPDGRTLAIAGDSALRLIEIATGREVSRLAGLEGPASDVSFSADGQRLLTREDRMVRLWSVATSEEVGRFVAPSRIRQVDLSPDGSTIVVSHGQYGTETVQVRDVERQTSRSLAEGLRVDDLRFSPDGRWIALAGGFEADPAGPLGTFGVVIWDSGTGAELRRFPTVAHDIAITADGRHLLTDEGRRLRLWDVATGEMVRTLDDPNDPFWTTAKSMSADGRLVVAGSEEGTIRVWDSASGMLLARLIFFDDGTWAVLDAEGRYDASNGGDVDGLHWVVGLEPIALEQLKERYYEPGLLAKVLGFNDEPLREVSAFDDVALYPEVRLTGSPTIEDPSAHVVLRNRGGGIGRVVVWLNGKEVTADARPAGTDAAADSLMITLDFAGSPYLVPGGDNRIEVRAFNAEGYLASGTRGLGIGSAAEADAAAPRLWAVVAGVSDYTGDALDLRYAAKDAADFAAALRLAGERLFGAERTHVALLTTEPGASGDLEPSRPLLTSVLRAIADSASATDVVVVYLAGHGVVHGGAEGDYYFLAREARNANLADPQVRAAVALSSLELTELLKAIPALKQVLILDTCGAGRAVEAIVAAREVPSSQIRAMQRMKDRTGTFVLAGSAADAVSYEASRYAQGVLTYSLLMGLKGAALREGEYIDVATLFGFAVDQVPQLARDIGGIQRPELAAPRAGQSFDIGRLTVEDRERIPLAEAKPLVLRSNFQDERRVVDHLRLTQLVDDALRETSAGSRGEGSMVFVDAESFPDAYSIAGRYAVESGEIRVSARLFRGEAEAGAFEVTGRADDLTTVAGRIRDRAEALIRAAAAR